MVSGASGFMIEDVSHVLCSWDRLIVTEILNQFIWYGMALQIMI